MLRTDKEKENLAAKQAGFSAVNPEFLNRISSIKPDFGYKMKRPNCLPFTNN